MARRRDAARAFLTVSRIRPAKLSAEDGGIEVEFQVDQSRNGVRRQVVVVRNGSAVARRTRLTRDPSGSFELVTRNAAGTPRFVGRATRAAETCTARAAIAQVTCD